MTQALGPRCERVSCEADLIGAFLSDETSAERTCKWGHRASAGPVTVLEDDAVWSR